MIIYICSLENDSNKNNKSNVCTLYMLVLLYIQAQLWTFLWVNEGMSENAVFQILFAHNDNLVPRV